MAIKNIKKNLTQLTSPGKFWTIEIEDKKLTVAHGKIGTFGKISVDTFHSDRACLKEADRLIRLKLRKGYADNGEGFMNGNELPVALRNSLNSKQSINTLYGKFKLFPAHETSLISIVVNPQQDSKPKGLFCTIGYALTKDPATEATRAVLVWLPRLELFGTWYPAERHLIVFPDKQWEDIRKDLPAYIAARENNSFPSATEYLPDLEEYFDFIPGNLTIRVGTILALQDTLKKERAREFLNQYAPKLHALPFSKDLEDAFEALVNLYYRMALLMEREKRYEDAIGWLEKGLLIIVQAPRFRSELFVDVFLQLGFCCLETSRFDAAIRYINVFQTYDASSWEACDQIKASIRHSQKLYKETMSSYLREMEERSNGVEEVSGFIEKAINTSPKDPILHFNLACFFAVSERVKDALFHLEEAFKCGLANRENILNEHDLRNVKHMEAFEDIRLKYL